MTATSTVLAPFVTPLLVWLLVGQTVDVQVTGMLLSILWVVILPIVAGLLAKWLWPKFTERATAYLPALSSLAICAIVLIIIAASIEVGMQNSGLASSLATLHFAAYPMATIPGAIFSVWHNISGAVVARLYARNTDVDQ